MYLSAPRKAALEAYNQFIAQLPGQVPESNPRACKRTKNGCSPFMTSRPQHWSHLRTTNPIRINLCYRSASHPANKGCGSRIATLTMVFKLGIEAKKHWRRLNGSALLPKVVTGVQFIDGEELEQTSWLNCYDLRVRLLPVHNFDNISIECGVRLNTRLTIKRRWRGSLRFVSSRKEAPQQSVCFGLEVDALFFRALTGTAIPSYSTQTADHSLVHLL